MQSLGQPINPASSSGAAAWLTSSGGKNREPGLQGCKVHRGVKLSLELLIQYALLVFMFVLCIIAIELKDLLYSIIVLAGANISLAVIFFMLQAPDIAITQAAVGAGVATVLFVIAISRTRRQE